MPILTLGFLFRNNKILLAMKKRGFGTGKWNGYGGKLLEGESSEDGLLREVKEESGITLTKNQLKEMGKLDFYFTDKKEWDQSVIVYRVDDFVGEPEETEEMKPEWFDYDSIPYSEMWAGDDQWIPLVVANKNFTGEITFTEEGQKVINCKIK